ncbi:uncharacterized protein UDID_18236 [Ustilago sp. UG-2017a]|nr:uncharacterized protein UDID_18236 [Ustilago sp. UG-2017a]
MHKKQEDPKSYEEERWNRRIGLSERLRQNSLGLVVEEALWQIPSKSEVMQFALEAERQSASAWMQRTTRVEEWGKGWLVVDGTHVLLAWKPGMMSQEHFSYKGFYSMNVALVILSHSLCIVESVVGQPGSVQDSKVWTSGSNILKKPQLYLDEGEFNWVDGGYGHSAFMVGPFSHIAAEKSCNLCFFNHSLSQVQVQVEHAIAYLKSRFQCLNRYRGNMYCIKEHMMEARTIHACIVAHTFASQYDGPDMVAELLCPSFSKEVVHDVVETLSTNLTQSGDMQSQWQANQVQYKEESMVPQEDGRGLQCNVGTGLVVQAMLPIVNTFASLAPVHCHT